MCFRDAIKALDLALVKQHYQHTIPAYIFPIPYFIFDDAWYEQLWTNRRWLALVESKVVRLREADM